eukprot:PhM_4_TR4977/c0_g1_i1/m.2879
MLQFPAPESTAAESIRRIGGDNYLTFRCRLDSQLAQDVHRNFSGCYNPRWRTMYINEIKTTASGDIRLLPTFPMETYTRNDNGDYFYTQDFYPGQRLTLGKGLRGCDDDVKTFIITDVDASKLITLTTGLGEWSKQYPQDAVDIITKIKNHFTTREGKPELGIKAIARKFRIIDDDGNRRLTPDEFYKGLMEQKTPVTKSEVERVFSVFDRNHDGAVSLEEFLYFLRGPMSEFRKGLVLEAFRKIDFNGDGVITVADVCRKFKASSPEAAAEFLKVWDTHETNGAVTYQEFADYYSGLSATIDEDEMFAAMMHQAWRN